MGIRTQRTRAASTGKKVAADETTRITNNAETRAPASISRRSPASTSYYIPSWPLYSFEDALRVQITSRMRLGLDVSDRFTAFGLKALPPAPLFTPVATPFVSVLEVMFA